MTMARLYLVYVSVESSIYMIGILEFMNVNVSQVSFPTDNKKKKRKILKTLYPSR